jgi:hypothetical protein
LVSTFKNKNKRQDVAKPEVRALVHGQDTDGTSTHRGGKAGTRVIDATPLPANHAHAPGVDFIFRNVGKGEIQRGGFSFPSSTPLAVRRPEKGEFGGCVSCGCATRLEAILIYYYLNYKGNYENGAPKQ